MEITEVIMGSDGCPLNAVLSDSLTELRIIDGCCYFGGTRISDAFKIFNEVYSDSSIDNKAEELDRRFISDPGFNIYLSNVIWKYIREIPGRDDMRRSEPAICGAYFAHRFFFGNGVTFTKIEDSVKMVLSYTSNSTETGQIRPGKTKNDVDMETKTYTKEELDNMPFEKVFELAKEGNPAVTGEYIQSLLIETSSATAIDTDNFVFLMGLLSANERNVVLSSLLHGNRHAGSQLLDYVAYLEDLLGMDLG